MSLLGSAARRSGKRARTDDKGKPYVAEFEGKNKGFFFLDPADALSFAERVKQLQQAGIDELMARQDAMAVLEMLEAQGM